MKLFKEPVSPKEQRFLLPPSVDEFVAPDAPVRILGDVMDQLDCSVLYKRYRGGGAPAFEPRRMLKTLVFGYSQGIRSSRKLAQALEYGATVVQLLTDFDGCLKLLYEVVQRFPAYLLNSVNPYRLEGQKTVAFELMEQIRQPRSAISQGKLDQRLSLPVHQDIKAHYGYRSFGGQLADAGLSRMNAHEQLIEGEVSVRTNDNFAIKDETARGQFAKRSNQFGKVPAERLPGFGLQQDIILVAECEAAEAVPLGLVKPARTRGNFGNGFGLRGRIGRLYWKVDVWEIGFQSFFWKSAGADAVAVFVVCGFLSRHPGLDVQGEFGRYLSGLSRFIRRD